MSINNQDIFTSILMVTFIFFVMMIFFIFILIHYYRKKNKHKFDLNNLKQEFEKQLLQSQLEIHEQVINEISQEIHDNVGQILSLAKVQLNIVEKQLGEAPILLKESKDNISRAMSDLRDIAKCLNTDRMEKISLINAIDQEVERLNKTKNIIAQINVIGEEVYIDSKKKLIIFRIVQETFNNVLKHASATLLKIGVKFSSDFTSITIEDNGKGFDQNKQLSGGLGLDNIIKRSLMIDGVATISSQVNKGTIITLNIRNVN